MLSVTERERGVCSFENVDLWCNQNATTIFLFFLVVHQLDSIWKSFFNVGVIDLAVSRTLRSGSAVRMRILLNRGTSLVVLSALDCTPRSRRNLLGQGCSPIDPVASIRHQLLQPFATIFSNLYLLLLRLLRSVSWGN